jgi:hypothetical protein
VSEEVKPPIVVDEKPTPAPLVDVPTMESLSSDDYAAVRNGTKKLEDFTHVEQPDADDDTGDEAELQPDASSEAGRELAKKKKDLGKRRGSIQGEIDALTRQKAQSKAEADLIAAEVARLKAERDALSKPDEKKTPVPDAAAKAAAAQATEEAAIVAAIGEPPTWEQYEADGKTYDDFLKADRVYTKRLATYTAEQRFQELQAAERRRIDDAQAARDADEQQKALNARFEQFKTDHVDVDLDALLNTRIEGLTDTAPGYKAVQGFITNEPDGLDVLLYLGEHPKEAASIAAMNPGRALMAVARISERISGAAHSGPVPEPKTTLPPLDAPVKPVRASRTTPKGPLSADADPDEWIAQRNAKERGAA